MASIKGHLRAFVVFGLLAIVNLGGMYGSGMAAKSESESAVRAVYFMVKSDARDRFFDQLRKFADENAFAIRIAPVRPDHQHFLIQLWREDIKGIGVNSGDPEKYVVAFFYNSEREAVVASAIHRLADNLTSSLTSVNGVTATKE
jgi:hypothetical protein